MTTDWDQSATAWIASQGESGDFSRAFVLDRTMLDRTRLSGARSALDVGCSEGRFCHVMQAQGIDTVGLAPTDALIAEARAPNGSYILASFEALPFKSKFLP